MTIRVPPEDTWDYFTENKAELQKSMIMIAEEPEYGVEIYITADGDIPNFTVIADGVEVRSEFAFDKEDCTEITREFYEDYLTMNAAEALTQSYINDGILNEEVTEELINDREAEIEMAVTDMLLSLTETGSPDYSPPEIEDDVVAEITNHICEYLYRKWKINVYRPMMMEDENGEEFFEEYPYEIMEYEDDDNPIYK